MTDIEIVMPTEIMGASNEDTPLDTMLREIAVKAANDPNESADKYGTNFENDVFMMHKYCWCDNTTCAWCDPDSVRPQGEALAPHFHYKPTGFKVWWYKYIGRDSTSNKLGLSMAELILMKEACMESLKG